MSTEPKGFRGSFGERIKRDKPFCTRTGIVIYKGIKDRWFVNYPDTTKDTRDKQRKHSVNTIRLMTLIYYLGQEKPLDKSRKLSGL